MVLIRGEGWGTSSLSADEDVTARWGECLLGLLVALGGTGVLWERGIYLIFFPRTGELG